MLKLVINVASSSADIHNPKSSIEAPIALYKFIEKSSLTKELEISFKNVEYSASLFELFKAKSHETTAFINAPYWLRL